MHSNTLIFCNKKSLTVFFFIQCVLYILEHIFTLKTKLLPSWAKFKWWLSLLKSVIAYHSTVVYVVRRATTSTNVCPLKGLNRAGLALIIVANVFEYYVNIWCTVYKVFRYLCVRPTTYMYVCIYTTYLISCLVYFGWCIYRCVWVFLCVCIYMCINGVHKSLNKPCYDQTPCSCVFR